MKVIVQTAPMKMTLIKCPMFLRVAACLAVAVSSLQAGLVQWGTTLDATAILTNGSVTYCNVNHEGYDIVVTTSNLADGGAGALGGLVPSASSWWSEGKVNSMGNMTFRFYETGTTNPVGLTGLHFRFEDAENSERFANFAYWDPLGDLQPILPNTSPVFTGSTPAGLNTSLAPNILENLAPYAGGTQLDKALDINLSGISISGFTLDLYRTKNSAGSVEMTDLGDLQMIPEPATVLFGFAITGVLAFRRRRVVEA